MTEPTRNPHRVAGPKVIATGVLIVLLITGFVILRVLQTRDSPPPPSSTETETTSTTRELSVTAEPATGSDQYTGFIVSPDTTLFSATYEPDPIPLTGTISGYRLLSDPGFWAIDYTWFFVPGEDERLLTFAEMDDLAQAGAISDTTRVGVAVYRVRAKGVTVDEARAAAEANRPKGIPVLVKQAFRSRSAGATADPSAPR